MSHSTPGLFASSPATPTETITAHCDGGARGNPGPAGYGAEITDSTGALIAELSEFLGVRTNNYAEYSGLLASLQYALDHGYRRLRVVSDSELMVKQIQGKYKVNSPDLKPLWQEAKNRIAKLDRFEITHALRHKNKAADRLANEAMDRGTRRGSGVAGAPAARPLAATPYPQRSETPPAPRSFDPRQPSAAPSSSERPAAASQASPAKQQPAAVASSARPARSSGQGEVGDPAMLRGFTRDGVVHILGSHSLPDGVFVKIIRE